MMKPLLLDTFVLNAALPNNDPQVVTPATLSPLFQEGAFFCYLRLLAQFGSAPGKTGEAPGKHWGSRGKNSVAYPRGDSLHTNEQVFYNALHDNYHHEKTGQGIPYAQTLR